ncbi:hypothetical protein K2Z84_23740 [Candidatus Binatia bacterium]|nr:hypothetical protein [Candidatus Binatia bacterium]
MLHRTVSPRFLWRRAAQLSCALAASALLVPVAASAATTLVVDDDGTYDAGTSGCDGTDAAYTTINAANTAAVDGDTIFVCPGTYVEIQINITKAITLQGSGAASTIIDGGGGTGLTNAGTLRIRTNTGNVKVDGFTIQGAAAQGASATGLRFAISSKSSAPVTYTITNNVIKGNNNPAWGSDYGVYTDGPSALETFIFQYNTITQTGSNPILIERHTGPTDVSYNTFDRGVFSGGISAYFNMSHTGTAITSLQRVSNNTIDLGNDPGPYTSSNASGAITFVGAFTGTTLGTFSNVEISGNVITNVQAFRRGITLTNNAAAPGTNGIISNAVVSCNSISGPVTAQTTTFGIRTFGRIQNPDISNNTISAIETGFTGRTQNTHIATGVVLEENSFSGVVNAIDWWSAASLDAETNWYGAASGPTVASNPSGVGAAIVATGGPTPGSPVVDYEPWLGTGADADAGTCFVPGDSGECAGPSLCDVINGCSAAPINDGGSCDDGLFCTATDTCNAGTCSGVGDPCTGGAECANLCDEANDSCNVPAGATCTDDGLVCSEDICDGAGACTHPAGNTGAICAVAADACELDAACDGVSTACPANPQLPDGDNDGQCDEIDACTTYDLTQIFATKPKSRLVLTKINTDVTPGNDGLVISASFSLAPGHTFAEVDPIGEGVRVLLLNDAGTSRLDAAIPGGAYNTTTKVGWKVSGNGKTWRYIDKSASPAGGIFSVVINNKSTASTPRGVKVTVKGRKGTYPVVGSDVPVQAIVTLGDATAAENGLCGESAYLSTSCAFNAPQNKLTCRR